MIFPFPFSIFTVLLYLGLLIARLMKQNTLFFITAVSFTEVVLKLNWIFLAIYMGLFNYTASFAVIIYCIGASLILNLLFWRNYFFSLRLDLDTSYKTYLKSYPRMSRFLLYSSFIISF